MSQDRKHGNPHASLAFPNGSEQEVYGATDIVTVMQYNDDGSYYVKDWMNRERRVVRLSVLVYEDEPVTRQHGPRTAAVVKTTSAFPPFNIGA